MLFSFWHNFGIYVDVTDNQKLSPMKYALTTILGILMIAFVTAGNHQGSNQTHYIYDTKDIEERNTPKVEPDGTLVYGFYQVEDCLSEDIML